MLSIIPLLVVSVYVLYVFGFGFLIVKLLGYAQNQFLLAFGIGVSVLVLTQLPFRILGGEYIYWLITVHVVIGSMIVCALIFNFRKYSTSKTISNRHHFPELFGAVSIAFFFCCYHILVGPYTEIPSDFWARLGDVKEQLIITNSGFLADDSSLIDLIDDKLYIPFLHASVAYTVGVLPIWIVGPATLVTSLCFLLGTYWFTLKVVAPKRLRRNQKIVIALLTALFTLLAYGVSTFSYVRYYAYFPHIINATMMLLVLSLFIDLCRRKCSGGSAIVLIAIFVFVMGLINQQEALLVIVLMVVLCLWKVISTFRRGQKLDRQNGILGVLSITLLMVPIGYVCFMPTSNVFGEPHLIDFGHKIPLFRHVPVANPQMRFWDTLGIFGLVTYIWYLSHLKWFEKTDYINVAMASPLYTLFNPLFVLWFISIASWDPLWRFSYLMPLPIVAAYLVVRTISKKTNRRVGVRWYFDYIMLACLIISLTPFSIAGIQNGTSKVHSLTKINETNGRDLWSDLIRRLEAEPAGQRLVTDSITNYVLTAALQHEGTRRPKETWQQKIEFFNGDYKDKLLYYQVDDSLLIINQRDGGLSQNGRLSGHWPDNVLKVSRIYPDELMRFVNVRSSDFKLIWEGESVSIYKILRDPLHY